MIKYFISLSFILLSMFSVASDFKLGKKQNDQPLGSNTLVLNINPGEILTYQMAGAAQDSDKSGQLSWISKTIFLFDNGLNLAGFNVKMNKLNLVKRTGWVNQKEWNLHADVTNNGLSIKYQF